MAKWKIAGHMAVAQREAEKAAELKRIQEEQIAESIRNGKIMRSLQRSRDVTGRRAKITGFNVKRMIDCLNRENINQMWDQHVSKSAYYQKQDNMYHQSILDSIGELDEAKDEAKQVRAAMSMVILKEKETEKAIDDTQAELKNLKQKLDMVRFINENKVMRRIELAQQKYGLQLTENRSLVDQIKHLRMEQASKRNIHDSLKEELAQLSKELTGYIEEAQTTYEQRDLNRRNMVKLREHLEKSTQAFDADMQLLQFKIDVLKRMERFITTKNKFRPDFGKERRKAKSQVLSIPEKDSIMFSGMMEKIRDDLQEDDLFVIIKTFRELEEENYMLFKNISDTRDTCHSMQMEIDETKEKIRTARLTKTNQEQESVARRSELKEKLDICKKVGDIKEANIKECDRMINVYIKGTLSILSKMGYHEREIEELAGVYKKIEERNIRTFLGEIENYVNKLSDLKFNKEFLAYNKARKISVTVQPTENQPPRLPMPMRVQVVPPAFEEEEDVEDPELPMDATFRPYSVNEMEEHMDVVIDARDDEPEVPPPHNMTDVATSSLGEKARKKKVFRIDVF